MIKDSNKELSQSNTALTYRSIYEVKRDVQIMMSLLSMKSISILCYIRY